MAKNILVLGGAGYIGSHTCKLISATGNTPVVLDNLVYGHENFVQWGPFIKGDHKDQELVAKVLKEHQIKDVIHFSAYAYVGESVENPKKYFENNVVGTLSLLDTCVQEKVKNIVFSSSCATYGEPPVSPIDESTFQNPINPYGDTKLIVEKMLKWYSNAYDFNFAALRYFNAAGASHEGEIGEDHNPETHLIPLALKAVADPDFTLSVYGDDYSTPDGTCIRDYIHVLDLADAHIRALDYIDQNNCSDFFNLGTGKGNSVKEVVDTVAAVTGKECKHKITARRPGDPPELVASVSKGKEILGWSPQHSDLKTIVETAWKWYQKIN